MKRLLAGLTFAAAVAVVVVAAVALASSGRTSSRDGGRAVSPTNLPPAAPAGQMTLYGHIRALAHVGGRVELRFDPAWVTQGLTARRASLADTGSSEVLGQNYVVESGHRLFTYVVAPTATIRIIANNGAGPVLAPIRLAELIRIIDGRPHSRLWEPLSTGVWIRVHTDTIREIDQQYQP